MFGAVPIGLHNTMSRAKSGAKECTLYRGWARNAVKNFETSNQNSGQIGNLEEVQDKMSDKFP